MIDKSFNENDRCGLHPDADHTMERCDDFKQILQDLMDKQLVQVGYTRSNNDVLVIDDSALAFSKPLVIHYTRNASAPAPMGPKPITIQIPTTFPYQSNKAVPWRYGVEVCTDNVEENSSRGDNLEASDVTNIAEVGGMTRSGRIYTPDELRVRQTKGTGKDKEKEKEVAD